MNKLVINYKDVDISIGGREVFKNISYSQVKAEFCYVVGNSGSGKSTFLKSLYAENPVSGQEAFVVGQDLTELNFKKLPFFRRKIGMIFQDFKLFNNWTVSENLIYVMKATSWKETALMKENLESIIDSVKLRDYLNVPVNNLSGGEKQRVAIARAILNKPELIIADEPTGNLDPSGSDSVLKLLHELAKKYKTAIIMATHDYRLIEKFPARVFECSGKDLIER